MAKKFHTVVILLFLLTVASFSSSGNSRTVPALNGYILQDSTIILSQMEMEITPSKAISFYNKGKFPLKLKFIIRIKALNDYSAGSGVPARRPAAVSICGEAVFQTTFRSGAKPSTSSVCSTCLSMWSRMSKRWWCCGICLRRAAAC